MNLKTLPIFSHYFRPGDLTNINKILVKILQIYVFHPKTTKFDL